MVATPNGQAPTAAYWLAEDPTHEWLYTSGSLYYFMTAAGLSDFRILDPYAIAEMRPRNKRVRKAAIRTYLAGLRVRNRLIGTAWHEPSEDVVTWEIKVAARRSG